MSLPDRNVEIPQYEALRQNNLPGLMIAKRIIGQECAERLHSYHGMPPATAISIRGLFGELAALKGIRIIPSGASVNDIRDSYGGRKSVIIDTFGDFDALDKEYEEQLGNCAALVAFDRILEDGAVDNDVYANSKYGLVLTPHGFALNVTIPTVIIGVIGGITIPSETYGIWYSRLKDGPRIIQYTDRHSKVAVIKETAERDAMTGAVIYEAFMPDPSRGESFDKPQRKLVLSYAPTVTS